MNLFKQQNIFYAFRELGISRATIIIDDISYEYADTTISNDNLKYDLYPSGERVKSFTLSPKNRCPQCGASITTVKVDEDTDGFIIHDIKCDTCNYTGALWHKKQLIGSIKNVF